LPERAILRVDDSAGALVFLMKPQAQALSTADLGLDPRLGARAAELEAAAAAKAPARIFIYGINYAPELIGVGRYTGELGAYLAGQGHQVEVVTAQPHYPGWAVKAPYANRYSVERSPGHSITRCPLLLREDMRGIWRILAPLTFALASAPVAIWKILTTRPDTVLCVEPTLFSAPFAVIAAKLVGARTVLHVQDLEIDAAFAVGHVGGGWLKSLANAFEALTLKPFDAVVTISDRMRQRLCAKGVRPDRALVIRNWVDTARIKPIAGPNRFRRELGLADDATVALYAGNIGAKQALHIVLDAAERLVDRDDLVFVIAGDGPERARLMARGLPNVRFLPLQPEALFPELLAAADVHLLPQAAGAADLVLPSKLGGMLASGKPLLVQADPGTELHGFLEGAAILAPAGDAAALAEALGGQARDCERTSELRRILAMELSATKILPDLSMVLSR
jgi:colanic acid biosynthesis glycosyl transferase WcaI